MKICSRTLIVVPTGGLVRDRSGQLQPSHSGNLRLNRAAALLAAEPEAMLAISGGDRGKAVKSEADVYLCSLIQQRPELAGRVAIVDASSFYTAGDMVALAVRVERWETAYPEAPRFSRVDVVSHPAHARLAILSLNAGFQRKGDRSFHIVKSGETDCYTLLQRCVLNWVTRCDPRWERWLSWPLRWLARHDGRFKTPTTAV